MTDIDKKIDTYLNLRDEIKEDFQRIKRKCDTMLDVIENKMIKKHRHFYRTRVYPRTLVKSDDEFTFTTFTLNGDKNDNNNKFTFNNTLNVKDVNKNEGENTENDNYKNKKDN